MFLTSHVVAGGENEEEEAEKVTTFNVGCWECGNIRDNKGNICKLG